MNHDHFLELLDDYLENALSEERQADLEQTLRDDPHARELFWKFIQQEVQIQKIEREARGQTLAQETGTAAEEISPTRRRSRWVWWAGLAASILLLGMVGLSLVHRPEPAAEFVLAHASNVVVVRDNVEEAGHAGMALRPGDRIAVAEEGSATIQTRHAERLEIGPETTIGLTGKVVELLQGTVIVERTSDGQKLLVETPTADAVVGEGRAMVVAAPTSTRLEVESGTATLLRKSDGGSTTVSAGAYAVAAPKVPLTTRPLPASNTEDTSPVILSTWLGGSGARSVRGLVVAPDGCVLIAGTLPDADLALWRPERQIGQGDAMVLRLSADGSRLLAVRRFGGSIDSLHLDDAGNVYVAGSFGCVRLDPTLRQALWSSDLRGSRIVAGPEGGAVVLTGGTITRLDGQGKPRETWTIADRRVHDIACDVRRGLVFAIGSSLPAKDPPMVPFVHAYDLKGQKLWGVYDWPVPKVIEEKLTAGSEGLRLALGQDGQLYIAGQTHGGNTVFGRQSDDLSQKLMQPRGGRYQSAYNSGSQYLTFVARLDPRTGRSDMGSLLLGRHVHDQGVSMRPTALTVDAEGRIYVGGWAGATPPVSRGAFGLHGEGGGAFLCVFDRDFNRLYSARLCGGTTTALASGPHSIAVAGHGRDGLTTIRPFQPEPNGDDGWLVVFRKAPGIEYDTPIAPLPRR